MRKQALEVLEEWGDDTTVADVFFCRVPTANGTVANSIAIK